MMHHDVAPVFDEGQGDHHDSTAHYAAKKLRFCLTFLKKLHLVFGDDDVDCQIFILQQV